jgi:hypothetical protein
MYGNQNLDRVQCMATKIWIGSNVWQLKFGQGPMYGNQNSIALWTRQIFGHNLDIGCVQLGIELLQF